MITNPVKNGDRWFKPVILSQFSKPISLKKLKSKSSLKSQKMRF